ncbi:hypothetical protein BCR33DRAFT_718144, partial [Rhizoclosmatium globosum]
MAVQQLVAVTSHFFVSKSANLASIVPGAKSYRLILYIPVTTYFTAKLNLEVVLGAKASQAFTYTHPVN